MSISKKFIAEKMLVLESGKATPAPPVGPVLGALVGNVGAVCKEFNARTQHMTGTLVRVKIRGYSDKSYEMDILKSPTSFLIKKAAMLEKGSGSTGRKTIGSISRNDLRTIAEYKSSETTAKDIEATERTILGSMRSMGIVLRD